MSKSCAFLSEPCKTLLSLSRLSHRRPSQEARGVGYMLSFVRDFGPAWTLFRTQYVAIARLYVEFLVPS